MSTVEDAELSVAPPLSGMLPHPPTVCSSANPPSRSGKCGCPRDQCGDQCLDLRNNPNNCGKCGEVCDPKYCISGTCYKPSPEECAPDQAVTNNIFDSGLTNWTFAAFPGSTLDTDIKFGRSNYSPAVGDPTTGLSIKMYNMISGGRHGLVQQKGTKVCPKFHYELTYRLGSVNTVNDISVESSLNCDVKWVAGTPSSPSDTGGFPAGGLGSVGVDNRGYRTHGPWEVPLIQEGQAGVRKFRASLYFDLSAIISCRGPNGGAGGFVLTHIELKATKFAERGEETLTVGGQTLHIGQLVERADKPATNMTLLLVPLQGGPVEKLGE